MLSTSLNKTFFSVSLFSVGEDDRQSGDPVHGKMERGARNVRLGAQSKGGNPAGCGGGLRAQSGVRVEI